MAWNFACVGNHWILRYVQHRPSKEATSGRGNSACHPPDGALRRDCAAVGSLPASNCQSGSVDLHERRWVAHNWYISYDRSSHTHGLLVWV